MTNKQIIKKFDARIGTFITESGTKIERLTVVPLSQAVNVLKRVLSQQKQECQKYIDAEGNIAWQLCERRIKKFLLQQRQELINEMIKLSDKIEEGKETKFEEWKAFKHFRNTMRDKLKNEK